MLSDVFTVIIRTQQSFYEHGVLPFRPIPFRPMG